MAEQAPYRLYLRQDQIPTQWYNLRADMPEPPEPMRLPNGNPPISRRCSATSW